MEKEIGSIKKEFYIGDIILSTNFEPNLDMLNTLNNIIFAGCIPEGNDGFWKVNFIFSQNLIFNLALLKIYTNGLLASGSSGNMTFILGKNDKIRFTNNLTYENKKVEYIEFLDFSKDKIEVAIYSEQFETFSEEILQIRKLCPQAICFASKDFNTWKCVCGTVNQFSESKKVQNCSKCGYNRDYILNNFIKK